MMTLGTTPSLNTHERARAGSVCPRRSATARSAASFWKSSGVSVSSLREPLFLMRLSSGMPPA